MNKLWILIDQTYKNSNSISWNYFSILPSHKYLHVKLILEINFLYTFLRFCLAMRCWCLFQVAFPWLWKLGRSFWWISVHLKTYNDFFGHIWAQLQDRWKIDLDRGLKYYLVLIHSTLLCGQLWWKSGCRWEQRLELC
jgi:hypothetical protein